MPRKTRGGNTEVRKGVSALLGLVFATETRRARRNEIKNAGLSAGRDFPSSFSPCSPWLRGEIGRSFAALQCRDPRVLRVHHGFGFRFPRLRAGGSRQHQRDGAANIRMDEPGARQCECPAAEVE